MLLYKTLRIILKPIIKVLFLTKTINKKYIPQNGPYIISANHISFLDPLLIALAVKNPITFLAKKELFDNPFLGFILRKIGAVPISRDGSDISALRVALKQLKENKVIAIFPQGTRIKDKEAAKEQAFGGLGLMMGMAKVPVLPVGIYNKKKKIHPFSRNTIIFGEVTFPLEYDGTMEKTDFYRNMSFDTFQKSVDLLEKYKQTKEK